MLKVCTWHWGAKYDRSYVDRLAGGVRRHLRQPHDFIVMTPDSRDEELLNAKGCFARLRMFDDQWMRLRGFKDGDRCVVLDLDLIPVGPMDELFDRPEPFVILQGANASNSCPYNGSVWMTTAGYRPDVWSSFSLAESRKSPFYEFPDDQGWFWHKIPDAAGWKAGSESGIYAFQKPGWPKGTNDLPSDARLVAFPGKRDPSQFTHLMWVREHWRV